ncbi:MAG: acetyl-CoA carboxylase carboxyltransferase subunit beta [Candidatus Eremiobacteraeota bacterium]|nr:acetyl-CoA carboxylase carboxyltransferase subunit beta [Candidatus Eremiobacteraeota bacterium]
MEKIIKEKSKPEDLWIKCSNCGVPIFRKSFIENLLVCEKCDHHHKMPAKMRLEVLLDQGSFKEWDSEIAPENPLGFDDEYEEKLIKDMKKTGLRDGIITGRGSIHDYPVAIGVMEFGFRGGSMGAVVGEKVTRLLERAVENKLPAIIITASGGARMQEGMYSLMQLAKTNGAVLHMQEARLPYITVLTDPTTAGVAASYASVADIILAEPKAIIGFSGRRVIEQTIRQKLPPDFQTSEFYLEHGFIDGVIHRTELRKTLALLLSLFDQKSKEKKS